MHASDIYVIRIMVVSAVRGGELLLIDVVFRRNTTVLVPNNFNLKH